MRPTAATPEPAGKPRKEGKHQRVPRADPAVVRAPDTSRARAREHMAASDAGGLGKSRDLQLQPVRRGWSMASRRRVVDEDGVWFADRGAGEGAPLLPAARQDLVPALALVESVPEMVEPDLVQ